MTHIHGYVGISGAVSGDVSAMSVVEMYAQLAEL